MEAVMQGRKKKIAFIGIITVLLLGMLGSGITIYIKRRIDSRMVCGLVTDYTYYDRKLTAEDFLQFDYNTTYEEMIECLGEEMDDGDMGQHILITNYVAESMLFAIVWQAVGCGLLL